MPENDERNPFLGEIETEIVGMKHQARIVPGEQVNLERESKDAGDKRTIRVENGLCEPVGYLPKKMASWLAPLMDSGQIHLDGYVPQVSPEASGGRCRLNLMVFQCDKGLLEKAEPTNDREAIHQTVLQAYQSAQGYQNHELILARQAAATIREAGVAAGNPTAAGPVAPDGP